MGVEKDKNLRWPQALPYNITSVAQDMSAATEAASPLQKRLLMYLPGDGDELSKAEASTAASWWDPGADHAYTELQQSEPAR